MPAKLSMIRATLKRESGKLFSGRIARTTFVFRVAVLFGAVLFMAAPFNTFLEPATKTVRDGYTSLSLLMLIFCLLGFTSAYVKRLHDIGMQGYWAVPLLIGIPALIGYIGYRYEAYRYDLDAFTDLSGFNDNVSALSLALPLLFGLWPGVKTENQFGPVPEPVEHILASKFNVIAIGGTALVLIPFSIYAGLFQSGIWVGRSGLASAMPMMESNVPGHRFMKCWNVKGVGAGSGDGPASGIFRDAYSGNVFDFLITPSGQIDVAMAGERGGSSHLADGFRIFAYGIKVPTSRPESFSVASTDRFMILAIYDQAGERGAVNYTAFTFAKNKDVWPEYHMVLTSAISSSASAIDLGKFPAAKGRLMIGDCMSL